MNSLLKPLALRFADPFEKQYQIDEIPSKFMAQTDDYEPRTRKDPEDESEDNISIKKIVEEQEMPPLPPREALSPTRRTIYTMQELSEPFVTSKHLEGTEPDYSR
jgi:hypothetical protein